MSSLPPTANEPIVMECFSGRRLERAAFKSNQGLSFEECQKSCEAEKECVAFTHSEGQQLCKTFQTIDESLSDAAFVTGIKHQLGISRRSEGTNCASYSDLKGEQRDEAPLCRGGIVTGSEFHTDVNGYTYEVYFDFSRGYEPRNRSACGREYHVSYDKSNPHYGVKSVYLVDSNKVRVDHILYVENSDGSLMKIH